MWRSELSINSLDGFIGKALVLLVSGMRPPTILYVSLGLVIPITPNVVGLTAPLPDIEY
jgi:hypothetical protein